MTIYKISATIWSTDRPEIIAHFSSLRKALGYITNLVENDNEAKVENRKTGIYLGEKLTTKNLMENTIVVKCNGTTKALNVDPVEVL